MRFCVVGAGAIGSTIAARLAGAGHDVTVLARNQRHDALRAAGLTLRDSSGVVHADVQVRDRPEFRRAGCGVSFGEGAVLAGSPAAAAAVAGAGHDRGADDQRAFPGGTFWASRDGSPASRCSRSIPARVAASRTGGQPAWLRRLPQRHAARRRRRRLDRSAAAAHRGTRQRTGRALHQRARAPTRSDAFSGADPKPPSVHASAMMCGRSWC